MLAAGTHVVLLPADVEAFNTVWSGEVGGSLTEWLGHPAHARGELMLLDAEPHVLASLLDAVGREHPAVNLKIGVRRPEEGSVKIIALASGHGERARRAVDAALADMERAAGAARVQVSSSGRVAAHPVGIDG
jgi:hypothetical protein